MIPIYSFVLGHGASSQFLLSVVSPLHVFPPFSAFCIISRDIIFVADVPHVALHGPSDQGPNSQSTKTESKILLFRENSLYVLVFKLNLNIKLSIFNLDTGQGRIFQQHWTFPRRAYHRKQNRPKLLWF